MPYRKSSKRLSRIPQGIWILMLTAERLVSYVTNIRFVYLYKIYTLFANSELQMQFWQSAIFKYPQQIALASGLRANAVAEYYYSSYQHHDKNDSFRIAEVLKKMVLEEREIY